MSLSELNTKAAADHGVEVEILHPKTNASLNPPVFITILGTDSETYRRHQRKVQNRRLENLGNRRRKVKTAEEIETEEIETLAVCTVAWRTGDDHRLELEPGQMFDCTLENVKKLYTDPGFTWLRDQVDLEMGDRANFLKR
jgi:hypothetical protein